MDIREIGDALRIGARDDHDAISIAANDVAGIHRNAAARNRHVDGARSRAAEDSNALAASECRDAFVNNSDRVPDRAIDYDTLGSAELHVVGEPLADHSDVLVTGGV